ncbi:relaxase domain-containing protein [Oerskovia sp. M15]
MIATAFTHRDSRAATPTCTPTSPWPTRCRPDRGSGCRSTARCSSSTPSPPRRPTTLHWSCGWPRASGGVRGAPGRCRDKRPVREIAGVPALLCERWSQRRKAITTRQRELAREFTQAHGRPPTPVEAVALAQQANLETRDAKHEPRAEAEQRAGWRAEAVEVLGSQVAVRAMVGPSSTGADPWLPGVLRVGRERGRAGGHGGGVASGHVAGVAPAGRGAAPGTWGRGPR